MKKGAELSEDGIYRYSLTRCWDEQLPTILWVMLNPSRADASRDDNTITRCINFSRSWGYGSLEVGNLFALRTPNPIELMGHPDPVGPLNDEWLKRMVGRCDMVIAAWGEPKIPILFSRIDQVMPLLGPEVYAVNASDRPLLTAGGEPRHPRILPISAKPKPLPRS